MRTFVETNSIEVTLRFIWDDNVVLENRELYFDKADAEESVEEFIARVYWTFGNDRDIDWDWKAEDRIDIWIKE